MGGEEEAKGRLKCSSHRNADRLLADELGLLNVHSCTRLDEMTYDGDEHPNYSRVGS